MKVPRGQKASVKWPIVEQEKEKFMSILAGPPASNPSHTAVRVVMGLETTSTEHIIHPSTSVDSTDDYFRCVTMVSIVITCYISLLDVISWLCFREHQEAIHSQLHKHFKEHLKLEFKASSWKREPFCVNIIVFYYLLFFLSICIGYFCYCCCCCCCCCGSGGVSGGGCCCCCCCYFIIIIIIIILYYY